MNGKSILLGVFTILFAVFAGIEWWVVAMPILLGAANAIVNNEMINRFKVGKLYHLIQVSILAAIMIVLVAVQLVPVNAALLMTMFYWIPFEMILNLLRGLDADYIGTTAGQDRFIRKVFNRYAYARTALVSFKLFAITGGFLWFMWHVPV